MNHSCKHFRFIYVDSSVATHVLGGLFLYHSRTVYPLFPHRVIEAKFLLRPCPWLEAVTINSKVEDYGSSEPTGYVVPTDSPNSPDITDIDNEGNKHLHSLMRRPCEITELFSGLSYTSLI